MVGMVWILLVYLKNLNNMAQGVHKITEDFERSLCDYTGAPYAIALDNMSNALFLALYYEKNIKKSLTSDNVDCPSKTYPSVPCEIIHAGLKVNFTPVDGNTIKGAYQLSPSNVWDSALRFTADMYIPKSYMCVSFTGPYKTLKLSKGGAILTDDYQAMLWFKRARFSGRRECSYHDDNFDMIGWNFYMMPELSARGLLMMSQFYDLKGNKKQIDDLELPYPDLSKYKIYHQ
jgi:dTDP-4-amino-4,6-dideoxygalactose transaminase